MKTKVSTFERFQADIERGDTPRTEDVAELERRADELHNSYPQKIDGLNAALKDLKARLDALRGEHEATTSEIVQAVTMARTPENKPVYSNESLRQIEIGKRIAAHPTCAEQIKAITALESEHAFTAVLLQRAQNDYAAWKDLIRLELAARATA